MTRKAFLTVAWDISETTFGGPYPDKETAQEILGEEILGTDMQGGIIGPLPFEQVITDGKWKEEEADKSLARQWAVFEVVEGDLQWITFGDESELKEDFNFYWIGNYEGSTPAEAYAQANENGGPKEGYRFIAVPVGVFGPADWMRAAGDMLTKIEG